MFHNVKTWSRLEIGATYFTTMHFGKKKMVQFDSNFWPGAADGLHIPGLRPHSWACGPGWIGLCELDFGLDFIAGWLAWLVRYLMAVHGPESSSRA
jgi:hypothetical protein